MSVIKVYQFFILIEFRNYLYKSLDFQVSPAYVLNYELL